MSKKFYMAPESEELMLMTEGFLAASGDPGDGDSITNPGEGDEGDLM
jgi:hypothetical protein